MNANYSVQCTVYSVECGVWSVERGAWTGRREELRIESCFIQ